MSLKLDADVIVAGAGPAGAVAAYTLARWSPKNATCRLRSPSMVAMLIAVRTGACASNAQYWQPDFAFNE